MVDGDRKDNKTTHNMFYSASSFVILSRELGAEWVNMKENRYNRAMGIYDL